MDFLSAVKTRRSVYGLGKKVSLKDEQITEIITEALLHTPSAFNMQSARVILLLGDHHEKVWTIVKETLRPLVKPENFSRTESKINSFAQAYGTILYFEEQKAVASFQKDYPTYKDNFPIWAQQASGMLQYVIWTALAAQGLGVNIQHYNPLIDEEVKATWSVPASWQLIAQMPFGSIEAAPSAKDLSPIAERLTVFN